MPQAPLEFLQAFDTAKADEIVRTILAEFVKRDPDALQRIIEETGLAREIGMIEPDKKQAVGKP